MSIKIYRDNAANAIFIEDANGVQFLNSLQASVPSVNNVTITDLSKQIDLVANTNHVDFVDENDNSYGSTDIEVCNALNIVFTGTGTTTTNLPIITSSLVINSVQGSVINYELTADYGVGYEWDLSSVSGIVNVEGNVRKIIGGSSLASGVYNIPIKAINYNGEASETLVLTVDEPDFSNTKSINFEQNDYLSGDVSEIDNVFGRASNGDGNAWSISTYFKAGSHNNSVQTIMFAGGNSSSSDPMVLLYWEGNHAGRQNVSIRYGSNYNYIEKSTPLNSVSNNGDWHHIMVTFDGGTTGNQSGQLSQYYSRFKVFLDGVEQTTINSHAAFGNASAFNIQVFRVGRWGTGSSTMRNSCKVDELVFWDSDQSSNIAAIYNSGVPFDLSSFPTSPSNWWRMGDEDTYPLLLDSSGTTDLTMNSMTAASIVNDVPI